MSGLYQVFFIYCFRLVYIYYAFGSVNSTPSSPPLVTDWDSNAPMPLIPPSSPPLVTSWDSNAPMPPTPPPTPPLGTDWDSNAPMPPTPPPTPPLGTEWDSNAPMNLIHPPTSPLDIVDWALLQAHACRKHCLNGTEVGKSGFCSSFNCFPCDCDASCAELGTCCPTYHVANDTYSYDLATPTTSPWYDLFDCRMPSAHNLKHAYLIVVKCPASWTDEFVRGQCERPSLDSLDSVTPFSDKTTGLVFRNAPCAVCNGRWLSSLPSNADDDRSSEEEEEAAYPWPLAIQCGHYQDLYHYTDTFQFMQAAVDNELCDVEFDEPSPLEKREGWVSPRRCKKYASDSDFGFDAPRGDRGSSMVPSSCVSPDDSVGNLCRHLPFVPALVVDGFRNVFCAKCAGLDLGIRDYRCRKWGKHIFNHLVTVKYSKRFSLSLMYLLFSPHLPLLFSPSFHDDPVECPSGYWRNEKNECSMALCTAGKLLSIENSTCTTAISQITALGYNVSLVLIPSPPVFGDDIDTLFDEIIGRMTALGGDDRDAEVSYRSNCSYNHNKNASIEHYSTVPEIHVSGHFIGSRKMGRDHFEGRLQHSLLQSPWTINATSSRGVLSVSLQVVAVGAKMKSLYESRRRYEYHSPQDGGNSVFSSSSGSGSDLQPQCQIMRVFDIRMRQFYFPRHKIDHRVKLKKIQDRFIDITPHLLCPYVEVNLTAYSVLENGSLALTISVRGVEFNITQITAVSVVNGTVLRVCLETFKNLREPPKPPQELDSFHEESTILTINYYSEIICTGVSVVFLGATFITYCLFKPLRTLPGLNNMGLCISLATAQSSLMITGVFGVRGRLHETYCLVNGMIVHYSWLATFCWLNACCLHMFRVFTSTQAPRTSVNMKTYRLYCLYAFGLPGLVLVLTMAIMYGVTGRNSIGYNSAICFLDVLTSGFISIATLLVPFAVTMLANVVLFSLTVKEIVTVSRLHQHQSANKSHGILTYVKLSTVTGLFSVLEAVAVLTQNHVFTLLASPLMALQGLFIFLSFTRTTKVKELYLDLLSRRSTAGVGESSSSGYSPRGCDRTSSSKMSTQLSTA